MEFTIVSFNPCFNGMLSATHREGFCKKGLRIVSILVLMECSPQPKEIVVKIEERPRFQSLF